MTGHVATGLNEWRTVDGTGLTVTDGQLADWQRLREAGRLLSAAYSALPLWATYARQDIQTARDAVSRAQAASLQDDSALEYVG